MSMPRAGFLKSAKRSVTLVVISVVIFVPHYTTEGAQKCDQGIVITIERGSCFGSCPVYSAQIHANGTVVYEGKSDVKEIGERRFQVSEETIQKLIKEFERINYFSLKDTYQGDENGMSVTDLPTTITSICLNGKKKRVLNYYGAPKELRELEEKIDALTGLYKFIGPRW